VSSSVQGQNPHPNVEKKCYLGLAVACDVNLVVLIHEMHELGIDPVFWGDGDGNRHMGYTGTL